MLVKTRKGVTLRIPGSKKASAIFENLIHHKGYISILLMIDHMKKKGAPLYHNRYVVEKGIPTQLEQLSNIAISFWWEFP